MNESIQENPLSDEMSNLRVKIDEYKHEVSVHKSEIQNLHKQLRNYHEKVTTLEQENESLHRLTDRANQENDQLLTKFDSVSKAARILQDNEFKLKEEIKLLLEENKNLKQSVHDSNVARDNVIEKLKEVSLETRELIGNCDKAAEESKIFQIKSDELEEDLAKLRSLNESLGKECENLRLDVNQKSMEINSLQEKVLICNKDDDIPKFWETNVLKANDSLHKMEIQLREIIGKLNESESKKKELIELVEDMKRTNVILMERNEIKDDIIQKQSEDFLKVKMTVDEYHSEILRLDAELKDCHKRVSALNENLETINSENINLAEYTLFKQSIQKFNSLDNIQNLLSKLQVLQEIEQFFENKLAPHVDPSAREHENSDPIVTDSKENTINKIKNYLEKALVTIEKLNDKMLRLRNEYEIKLRAKNAEISTLRDLMLSATMYNRVLERSLQQFRDNIQLDNTIENKTNELLSVNASLMDSFEELKQVYQSTEHYNCFLFTKIKQLKLFFKIFQLKTDRMSNYANYLGKDIDTLFFNISEIFEEVDANEFRFKLSTGSETLMNLCEKKVTTNQYLKNMVENMSIEVKRLTSKVELEMAEKIQEIEILKGEMDNARTDNCDLVNKIKNCNREIVSLSTDNYDLNEKLQNLLKVEERYESLKRELNDMKNNCPESNLSERISEMNVLCHNLRNENNSLKTVIRKFVADFNETVENIGKAAKIQAKSSLDLSPLLESIRNLRQDHVVVRDTFLNMQIQFQNDFILLKNSNGETEDLLRKKLVNLLDACKNLRKQNESIKELDFKNSLNSSISEARSKFENKLTEINENYEKLVADFDSALKSRNLCEDNIVWCANRLKSNLNELKTLNSQLYTFVQELPSTFSKTISAVTEQMESAILSTVQNLKTSFASNNEEIIKEMQEMNLELKKRGSTISTLNQTLSEFEKEKLQILEKLREKEDTITAMAENKLKSEEANRENKEVMRKYVEELTAKEENVKNLSSEIANLKNKICAKDDVITSLEHEISKQRDGDTSSMGTISRTEEVSRLNDVEDSFEERYMKLRYLAVKMKKNINELNQELQIEKTERSALQNRLQMVTEQAKRTQVLQEECDKLADEMERYQNEIKELKKIILKSDTENENLKRQCAELTNNTESSMTEIASWKKEKINMEMKLKHQTEEFEKLSKEKIVEEMVRKERDKEVSSLKEKLKQIEDLKKKVQHELDQVKLEARKQGALTLEMKDYEKTISDLTNNIKEKEISMQQLSDKLNDSTSKNDSLNKQIETLEELIQSYVINNKTADEQIINLNKTIDNLESSVENSEYKLKQTIHQMENERAKSENLTLQLANTSAELKTVSKSFLDLEKNLHNQIKSLQEKLAESDENLRKRNCEFTKLKDDFEAYKVRAHNALQKCKMENNSKNGEEKLQSEINSLSSTLKNLRKQLDDTLNLVEIQKDEINLLKSTKDSLSVRVRELSETIREKSEEIHSFQAEHKSYKLNMDTLVNCYKVEIEKLKVLNEALQHTNREIQNSEPLKESDSISWDQKNCVKADATRESDFAPDNTSLNNLCYDLAESEIEAIEETERYRKTSKHSLIPLDKLLEREVNETKIYDLNEAELREHVENLEQQVKYLTSILNESEKNAARNEQQVTFLKDEIRRLQRMFEREPHLQNTEYVKNVLLKFITLPNGDEKHRLITVLETILKLTPNEKQTLSAVAKGYRADIKQPGGWTSFLNWS